MEVMMDMVWSGFITGIVPAPNNNPPEDGGDDGYGLVSLYHRYRACPAHCKHLQHNDNH